MSTFPLQLPPSLYTAVERMTKAEGTSMNQFLVMAAAEKVAAIQTAETWFSAFKGRGNVKEAIAFLSRPGGEPPRPGDKIAE
jgi:hypothetical protein